MIEEPDQVNLGQLVLRAFYWIDETLHQNLRKRQGPNITHAQSMVMMTIGDGITRPSAIAKRLGVSRQAIHQSLRELVKIDLIDLVPDPHDGRAKLALISPKGDPLRLTAREVFASLEAELGRRIGKQRAKNLRDALEQDWGEPAIFD